MGSNARACKLESAFRSMQQRSSSIAVKNTSGTYKVRQSSSSAMEMNSISEEAQRRRKEEKTEWLMNLIFWGPK
ncbi:hypothetical protein Scep_013271 [Stephania cephalantha]|uniref:Uncharacterized protein n=1 Tax=Stephania cephalantha TaxID=152367 RepID=A0AAP0JIJ8_9MAGN